MSTENLKDDGPPPIPSPLNVSVSMSPYEWHKLLSELEFAMCIVNRDQRTITALYEMISSQLNEVPVKVVGEK